jgi:hypothetical protein
MKNKILFFCVLLISTFTYCKSPQVHQSNSVQSGLINILGFVHGDCLAIKNKSLKKGDKVQLIKTDEPQELIEAIVLEQVFSESDCNILYPDRKEENLKDDVFFYKLLFDKIAENDLYISLLQNTFQIEKNNRLISIDINSDGKFEYFSACTTSEGIVFSVWSGNPWKSSELWSEYYYLGYDLEQNCPKDY